MKPKLNRKRRAGNAFNGMDKATGYAVRFEKTKQGNWCSSVNSLIALSMAPSLRTVKRHTNEAIGYHIEGAIEDGHTLREPEWREELYDGKPLV
jgi:hypothetical protein